MKNSTTFPPIRTILFAVSLVLYGISFTIPISWSNDLLLFSACILELLLLIALVGLGDLEKKFWKLLDVTMISTTLIVILFNLFHVKLPMTLPSALQTLSLLFVILFRVTFIASIVIYIVLTGYEFEKEMNYFTEDEQVQA